MNKHRTHQHALTDSSSSGDKKRSDGLFLVLAIGIVLLTSLLMPRSAPGTARHDMPDRTELASTSLFEDLATPTLD